MSRIHPREKLVSTARANLMNLVLDWSDSYDLTRAEELSVLASVLTREIGGIAKYAIREERHGSADKPGGLA